MNLRENLPQVVKKTRVCKSAVSVTIQTSRRIKDVNQVRTSVTFTVNNTTPEKLEEIFINAIANQ